MYVDSSLADPSVDTVDKGKIFDSYLHDRHQLLRALIIVLWYPP